MRRRELIASVLLAATMPSTWAQQPRKVYRVAVVHPTASAADMRETGRHPWVPAFFQELRRLGYVEGENLVIERYSTEGRVESWPERVRQAVLSNPDVIFAVSNRPVQQLKAATSMIPIVGVTADPVAGGLVTNLARPGGNLTGVALGGSCDLGEAPSTLAGSSPTGVPGGSARTARHMRYLCGHAARCRHASRHHSSWAPARRANQ